MAAKNKKKPVVRIRRRWRSRTMAEHRWRVWNHDLDTLLHEMLKNPALASLEPEELIGRAERFADALHNLQERRRPADIPADFEP